jgi:cell division protein FtsB
MGLFNRKADPITERSRALKAEIQALEAEIQKLSTQIDSNPTPRWRSTAHPKATQGTLQFREPIFEEVDQHRLKVAEPAEAGADPNVLGERPGLLRCFWNHLRGRPVSNPKLVNYLAAGSIQGLRPLRYERRVARNRFIALALLLVLVLWGMLAVILK